MKDDTLPPKILSWRLQCALAGLFFALALISRIPTFFRAVMDWDESLYFLMAAQWRAGHLPYTTIWDNKPIGIYAIFALFQAVFGEHIAAMRAASVVFTSLGAFAVLKITHAMVQPSRSAVFCGVFAGLMFLLCSLSNDGLAANTELFMACFTALAVLTALSPGLAATPWRHAGLTGLALGAAFMVKYVAVFEAPAVLFLLLAQHRRPDRVLVTAATILGAAIPLGLTILLYWQAGLLPLWWDNSIVSNIRRLAPAVPPGAFQYGTGLLLKRWAPLLAAAAAMLALALWQFVAACRSRAVTRRQIQVFFLAAWLFGGWIGVASAKSFYDHYFLQILPVLCVTLGWLLARLDPAIVNWPKPVLAMLMAAVIAWPAMAAETALQWAIQPVLTWQNGRPALQPDPMARIAADIAAAVPAGAPGPSVYIFNGQPIIYALARQTPPTRYVLPSELTGNFLAPVVGINSVAEVGRILAADPLFIVRARHPNNPADVNPAVYNEVAAVLAAKYQLWRSYKDVNVDVYRLKPIVTGPDPHAVTPGA
jgi:4-amino-4-deoxy-L-arabinose transferase-like glycosyltransferase